MSKISCVRSSLKRIRDPVVRERLLMVQAAYEMSLRDAAAKFCCTHGKIDFWKQRYEQEGVRGLYTRDRSGRPPKINCKQRSKLRRIVRKHNAMKGWRTRGIRELIRQETGVTYSFRHTIRMAQLWGLSKIKPRSRYAFSKKEDREAFLKKQGLFGIQTTGMDGSCRG
jgi:transposase